MIAYPFPLLRSRRRLTAPTDSGGVFGVGAQCCCGTDCTWCLSAVTCGAPPYGTTDVAVDFTVYSLTDADQADPCTTGTPIGDGHAAAGGEWCLAIPGPGTYAVAANAGPDYQVVCLVVTILEAQCPGPIHTVVHLPPLTFDATVRVDGCGPYGPLQTDGTPYPCTVPGVTVRWQDGTNDVTVTNDGAGIATFPGLIGIPDGTETTITVSGTDPACGYNVPATFLRYPGDLCDGYGTVVKLEPLDAYVCASVCVQPVKRQLTLTIPGVLTMSLDYAGGGDIGGGVWTGCTTFACDHAAEPSTCGGTDHAYAPHSGTLSVPIRGVLILTPNAQDSMDPIGDGCGPRMNIGLYLYCVYADSLYTSGAFCTPPGPTGAWPLASVWVNNPPGVYTSVALNCSDPVPAHLHQATDGAVVRVQLPGIEACGCPFTLTDTLQYTSANLLCQFGSTFTISE